MPSRTTRKKTDKFHKRFAQSGLTDHIVGQWLEQMPAVDPALLSITVAVTRLSILNEQMLGIVCKELGVSTGALKLLYALRRVGPPYVQRPTDLYQLLAVTSGAVTYTINLLVKEGLIQMVDDPQDGRSRLVGLTEKGLRLADSATLRRAELINRVESDLNPQEMDDTIECLLRLARWWEEVSDSQ